MHANKKMTVNDDDVSMTKTISCVSAADSLQTSTVDSVHQLSLNLDSSTSEDTQLASSLLSPQTPSSVFTRSQLSANSVFTCVVLSHWDNILGPRVRHLWEAKQVNVTQLNQVAVQTLSGEICRTLYTPVVDTRLFVQADLFVVAFVFSANTVCARQEQCVHSLALLMPLTARNFYMAWHAMCVARITQILAELRILLHQYSSEKALEAFSRSLNKFINMLASLRLHAIPRHIALSSTLLSDMSGSDMVMIRKAISCHLITCGRTVVLGRSIAKINQMVATLCLFLDTDERTCCRYASNKLCYEPDILVQGLLQTSDGMQSGSLKDMHLARYPSTVINLPLKDVRLSSLPHEHPQKRYRAMQQELAALWSDSVDETYPTCGLLESFDGSDTMVKHLLDELTLLPKDAGRREAYITHFNRLLHKQAISLISYVSTLSCQGKAAVKVKRLRQDLSFSSPTDFRIVLATAEKLQPGIYNFLCSKSQMDLH